MLEPLLRSSSQERVLLYLLARGRGHAAKIAAFYRAAATPIQKQLQRLEADGVVSGRTVGRARVYEFNPRYPFLPELKALLAKALSFCSDEEREDLLMDRRRPRKAGKPL
jgi:predicted ArsR family transcriptional regulator